MAHRKSSDEDETISIKDMQVALAEEIREVMKDAQLRIQEFSALTTAYAAGELTAEQATDKYIEYKDKWGDPLPGVTRSIKHLSDEQIIADMEKSPVTFTSREQNSRRSQPGSSKTNRIPE